MQSNPNLPFASAISSALRDAQQALRYAEAAADDLERANSEVNVLLPMARENVLQGQLSVAALKALLASYATPKPQEL